MRTRRARRASAIGIHQQSRLLLVRSGRGLPLRIELLRALLLLLGAIVAVLVGLPTLLEFAATPLR